jgi:hypothetical protein
MCCPTLLLKLGSLKQQNLQTTTLPEEILSRPINVTLNSEHSFRLARSWLKIYLEEHELCPKPRRDFMPTRLIHIEDERGN